MSSTANVAAPGREFDGPREQRVLGAGFLCCGEPIFDLSEPRARAIPFALNGQLERQLRIPSALAVAANNDEPVSVDRLYDFAEPMIVRDDLLFYARAIKFELLNNHVDVHNKKNIGAT